MTDTATEPTTDDTKTEDEPTTPAPAADPAPADTPKAKRGRGELEAAVKKVCDDFATGDLVLADGELLTPHRIAKIVEQGGTEASTGAVAAALTRWQEIGFASLNEKPLAFVDYTDDAREHGLTALKAAAAQRKRDARAAAKAAEKAASTPDDGQTETA